MGMMAAAGSTLVTRIALARPGRRGLSALAGLTGAALGAGVAVAGDFSALGHVAGQMTRHILLMNLSAPLIVLALALWLRNGFMRRAQGLLFAAAVVQLALIWGWHSPPVLARANSALGHFAMQASLFAAALWFWSAVIAAARWKAMFALLVTGKLFCLLGVLLVFAPRPLYGAVAEATMAGQQLAGLLMLAACPATYIVAGIVLAERWLGEVERRCAAPRSGQAEDG